MSITLTHPTAGALGVPLALALPDELDWPDELAWQQVQQATTYTLTGALLVESAIKQAGRPIILTGAPDRAWCPRSTVLTLRTWANQPGQTFTLSLHGSTYSVIFDHANGAISANQVIDYAIPDSDDWYWLTLKFLEIAA